MRSLMDILDLEGQLCAYHRVMVVTVEELRVGDPEEDEGQEGSTFLSMLDPELRGRPHITVGTRDASVPPFEAGALVVSFKNGENGLDNVRPEDVYMKGRTKDLKFLTTKTVQVVPTGTRFSFGRVFPIHRSFAYHCHHHHQHHSL
jgi:hypothetical protein